MMKQRIFGLLAAAVFAAAAVPAFPASADDLQIMSEQTGGEYWEGWNQDYRGTFELQDHPDGSITGTWDGIYNSYFRNGAGYAENEQVVGQLSAFDISYQAEISAGQGAFYYGVNGCYLEAEQPEYRSRYGKFYIIEGWEGYCPPGEGANHLGTAEIGGVQYDLYVTVYTPIGIEPPPPEVSYWSIRQENAYTAGKVCSGTVPLLEHIRAWDALDGADTWQGRNLRQVYFEADAWGGAECAASGSCVIAKPEIRIRNTEAETLTGDANCDGTVDISDAVLVMRYAVEDRDAAVTEQGLRNADADKNGRTDESDATMILKYIAKKITF